MQKFYIERTIPHDLSLGDEGSKLARLNYGEFTVEGVGPDKIRVSGDSAADCDIWGHFPTDIRHIAWRRLYPVSPVDRVFYSNGPDFGTAINGGGGSQGSGRGNQDSSSNITVNPVGARTQSLSGASGAEINVGLKVDGTGEPTLYTADQASNANDQLSCVAKHAAQTKLRIGSLKIFEVSSLSAELLRARTRFQLPGPYNGSLVGLARRPTAGYYTSFATLDPTVAVTPADLAYDMRFESDCMVQSGTNSAKCSANPASLQKCAFRRPTSLEDFEHDIRRFSRVTVGCFATRAGNSTPFWNALPSTVACTTLAFASAPSAAR